MMRAFEFDEFLNEAIVNKETLDQYIAGLARIAATAPSREMSDWAFEAWCRLILVRLNEHTATRH